MKLLNPTIYVPHKVGEDWAKSVFNFEGLVDQRRVRREIIRAFRRGGQKVSGLYIDTCIKHSLNPKMLRVSDTKMELPDDSATTEDD